MSDRKRAQPQPRDHDGEPLIDAGVLQLMVGMTPAGARRWAARQGVTPTRKGAHGASMYRLADIQTALDKTRTPRII